VKNQGDWRRMLGWTLWQLSRASGVERTRLSLIENGHVTPHAEEQDAIRRALLEETTRKKAVLASVEEALV
jgi:transcriptional regulator with XRE-family HTH domain